ncbi:uncharacterized protein TNCV_1485841 [Trichonephila clavipes]|nr:uncharacterized protein TNCV_1485841 [Trichonephila clavipes]
MDSLKLVHPFTLILAGPSGSGKSQFVKKLIENKMIKPFPKNIIWCYGVYQALYEEMPNISFHEDATSKPYGYLLIDLKPETDESLRVRTGMFPGDVFYVLAGIPVLRTGELKG